MKLTIKQAKECLERLNKIDNDVGTYIFGTQFMIITRQMCEDVIKGKGGKIK